MEAILMPKQGLQMTEGTLTRWLKAEGETVMQGEPLFEMETDKLTISIDASAGGTLIKIVHPVGDVVPINGVLAYVGNPGETAAPDSMGESGGTAASVDTGEPGDTAASVYEDELSGTVPSGETAAPARKFVTPRARMRAKRLGIHLELLSGSGPDGLVIERDVLAAKQNATPLARKLAEREHLLLSEISGSGVRGKITAGDVRSAADNASAGGAAVGSSSAGGASAGGASAGGTAVGGSSAGGSSAGGTATGGASVQDANGADEIVPLTGMRRVIARRMKESLSEQAQANHRMLVDMTEAARLREAYKAAGVKVGYNDLVLRCAARALTEFPRVNASMTDGALILKKHVNLGVAVATDDGLLVPVLRDADKMTLPEIARRVADLAARCKSASLTPDEATGGTFTVTNLGMYDVDSFTAIVNAPESGILAVGAVKMMPAVLKDGSVGARAQMWLSLTYDHRVIDGAPAAIFLKRIKTLLESPMLLL